MKHTSKVKFETCYILRKFKTFALFFQWSVAAVPCIVGFQENGSTSCPSMFKNTCISLRQHVEEEAQKTDEKPRRLSHNFYSTYNCNPNWSEDCIFYAFLHFLFSPVSIRPTKTWMSAVAIPTTRTHGQAVSAKLQKISRTKNTFYAAITGRNRDHPSKL